MKLPHLIPRILSNILFSQSDDGETLDSSKSLANDTTNDGSGRSKLMNAPDIVKETTKNIKNWLETDSPKPQGKISTVIPWYLQQATKDLADNFETIKGLEDQRIHEGVVLGNKSPWSLSDGVHKDNGLRNRYSNVLPWDKNRVKLPVMGMSLQFSDYINASHIKLSIPQISKFKRYYIATQGPTETTVPHFWQMCYNESDPADDSKPIIIVMVTPLVEGTREKCYQYWPDQKLYDEISLDSENPYDEGFKCSLSLCFKKSEAFDSYTVTELTLAPKIRKHGSPFEVSGYKPKKVYHFYYHQWSDFSKPDGYATINEISNKVWKINGENCLGKFNTNPVYVHCSAGVGRTGTFMTLDYLLNCCDIFVNPTTENVWEKDFDSKPDPINEIVQNLRQQRMMLVQSRTQYLFIYDTAEAVYKKKIEEKNNV